ncbi:tRNA threonylcarbamoyladenosine biosynthesis protein TsaB [Planctomycetes bacterium Pan216]|uniref:tRNA threonylcarbamoyladenosine biosynthesis protein TsaB n=1 Tax=Kolteria novifilia TaxID=2527975 RepID=A0A518BA50_9BACT|nr:tRNA threonylcarbamoyladenosine biosynthesis protein TsaB [Planctomycetes bacterium Pan216]
MRTLLIETSTSEGAVGLAAGTRLVARKQLSQARRHARDLIPAIGQLLDEAGWAPRSIELVIVDRGPGSYTGLRVGIMTAKTFCYATGAMLVGGCAADILAHAASDDALSVATLIDAQKGNIYARHFTRTGAGEPLEPTSELAVVDAKEWLATLPEGTLVTGPALDRFADVVPATLRTTEEGRRYPELSSLLGIGRSSCDAGRRDDPWGLEPTYLRPSEAEERWRQRHGADAS